MVFNFAQGLEVSVFLSISSDHYYILWGVDSKRSPGHYFGCDNSDSTRKWSELLRLLNLTMIVIERLLRILVLNKR